MVKLQLLFSCQLTLLHSTGAGMFAGEPQAVTAATVVGRWYDSGPLARTSSRSVARSTFLLCSFHQPSVLDSFAGQKPDIMSLLFSFPACLDPCHGLQFSATVPFSCWVFGFSLPVSQLSWRSSLRVIHVEGPCKSHDLLRLLAYQLNT